MTLNKIVILWVCHKCRKSGNFTVYNDEEILNVLITLKEMHRLENNFCEYDFCKVRVHFKRVELN